MTARPPASLRRVQTPSQTIGPFFSPALLRSDRAALAAPGSAGFRVRVQGRVLDGAGDPVPDAMLEVWQANANGRYDHAADAREDAPLDPGFHGFGRTGTDAAGRFRFESVKPGPVPGRANARQAPHLNLLVFARGLLNHLYTRVYFSDESEANAIDPVLAAVEPARRDTLVAVLDGARRSPIPLLYRFEIRLQGSGETVFFDF